jgi:putative FmdB family regulatory protein
MPTYQYECSACGHTLEALQSMTEPKLTKCPKCKKAKLVRLIGLGGGIIFKGTGFYETDYKKKDSGSDAACGCGTPESCGKTEIKTETKTETKSPNKKKK